MGRTHCRLTRDCLLLADATFWSTRWIRPTTSAVWLFVVKAPSAVTQMTLSGSHSCLSAQIIKVMGWTPSRMWTGGYRSVTHFTLVSEEPEVPSSFPTCTETQGQIMKTRSTESPRLVLIRADRCPETWTFLFPPSSSKIGLTVKQVLAWLCSVLFIK